VAVVAVLPVVGRIDHAALLADDGTRAAIDGDWTSAWASWDRALAEDPDMTLYRLERGIASANLGDLAAATTDLGDVVQVDPYPVHLVSLARLEAGAGARDGALRDAALALDRDATDPVVALNVGAIAERLNDAPLARRGYSEAIAGFPELAAAMYWREAGRLTELPNILSAAREVVRGWGLAGAAESAAAIRAYGGDPAAALVEVSALPDSRARDRTIALCIWLEGRRSEAIDRLRATLRAYPRDADTADLLSRLLFESGDMAGAANFREWADILGVGGVAEASVRGTEVLTVREAGTSGVAPNYPWMIYLRRAPAVLTPPDALVISAP
jgi:tetratricopeptide (TPR) repeat protein